MLRLLMLLMSVGCLACMRLLRWWKDAILRRNTSSSVVISQRLWWHGCVVGMMRVLSALIRMTVRAGNIVTGLCVMIEWIHSLQTSENEATTEDKKPREGSKGRLTQKQAT